MRSLWDITSRPNIAHEKIDLFNWYHFRFYPPHILFKMKEKINEILKKEKYEIDLSLQYKDINDLMLESQNFLLSLKQESDEIKNIINLRGTAKIVPIKSLPNDGKVIDDIRDFGE